MRILKNARRKIKHKNKKEKMKRIGKQWNPLNKR
jgi:hypothetical protein